MLNAVQKKMHTYLLDNGFIPADINSHDAIKSFNADNYLYDLTACLTVTWHDEMKSLYKIVDGFLCTANFYSDKDFCFFVTWSANCSGSSLQQVVDFLYEKSIEMGLDSLKIWIIEERFLDAYRQLEGYCLELIHDDNMNEYVFTAENLLDLNGSVNEEKRRQLRKFMDNPNVSLQPMTKDNVALCLEIEKAWCSRQDCDLCRSFAGCSKKTLEAMLDIFDGSVYQGILGYIEGNLAGYIVYEKVNEDIAFFYFAKTTVSNFSVYLYYICVQRYMNKAIRINIGADLGIKGLQLFKKRLGVYKLQKKYLCTLVRKG
jgi:hypothetical protein